MNAHQEAELAKRKQAFFLWHQEPETKLFFEHLRQRAQGILEDAAHKAIKTKEGNAAEHNNLVRARELLNILNIYGRTDVKYPYTSSDTSAD